MEPLELEFTVACDPARAFSLWAEETTRWWPRGHSVSAEPGLTVTFGPRPGGRVYERTPGGAEHDWGEVLAWEPPHRLVYLWHLRFDRADATEVQVSFTPLPDGTLVGIEHRGWERLGAAAEERRDRNRPRLGRRHRALPARGDELRRRRGSNVTATLTSDLGRRRVQAGSTRGRCSRSFSRGVRESS